MKTTRPNRGIMPQAARSAPFTPADAARRPNEPGMRRTAILARARSGERRDGRGQSERVFTGLCANGG